MCMAQNFLVKNNGYHFEVLLLCLSFFLENSYSCDLFDLSDTVGDVTLLMQSAGKNVVIQGRSTLRTN